MADHDVPEDLVALKAAFWAADARCAALSDQMPAADPQEQQRLEAELFMARAKRSTALGGLYAHPWWATQANRYQADQAVNNAARALADTE